MSSVARDLAMAVDPVAFAEAGGIIADPWQAEVLRSGAGRLLLNCCRQSGKSTTAATLAVHQAIYRPGSLTLLLSPTLRQSAELFRKCLDVWQAIGRPVAAESENKLSLELEGGSRIVSLPGKEGTIRGYGGVALLVVDEAARVPDDLYMSVRPMLAVSGGRLVALSTPWGKRGWWYTAWHSSDPWARWEVPATQCPRIGAAFLAEERRTLGDLWFNQEYLCRFEESATALFSETEIQGLLSEEVEPWSIQKLVRLGQLGHGTSA